MAVSTAAAAAASSAATAVDALLKWKNTQSNSGNPQLLPQDDFIYLILTLKKIPQKGGINGARTNPNKIPLPHPLIAPNSFSEICLIIDDRPNSKLTSEISKKKIKSDLIPVSKVIKLSKLKTDYKPFEAKRKLCDSYEMFFADKRVIPLLPKLLGKQFFKKKKLPLPVDLTHKNWKEQIERGCSSALLFFRTGTCCVIRVAKVSMERDEIVENVNAAIDGAIEFVPKKLSGVRSLHLKFSESVALPLYQSLPEIRLKIEGIKGKEIEVVKDEDEVMEIDQVEKNKKKKLKNGRIHEVNHDEIDDVIEEMVKDDSGSDDVKVTKKKDEAGKKKKSKKEKREKINEIENNQEQEIAENLDEVKSGKKSVREKKRKENVIEENDLNAKPVDKKAKKKGDKQQNGDSGKKEKINEIENNQEPEIAENLDEVKSGKKSVREKKRKENVIEENDLNAKPVDKKAKKKADKQQNGDSGKKEKKKGRSVSRV